MLTNIDLEKMNHLMETNKDAFIENLLVYCYLRSA